MQKDIANQSTQIVSPPISDATVKWVKRPRIASQELQRLRRLAKQHPATQSWFDETECPLELKKK